MGLIYAAPVLCLKLFVTALAAFAGYYQPRFFDSFKKANASADGLSFRVQRIKNRSADLTSFTAEIPTKVAFELRHETRFEKWFKRNRITEEIQTNDPAFDPAVYIKSDSASLANALRSNLVARTAIRSMLDIHGTDDSFIAGQAIFLGRGRLKAQLRGDQRENDKAYKAFASLHKALATLTASIDAEDDRYLGAANLVNAVMAALIAYAFCTFIEFTVYQEDHFVHVEDMIKASAVGAGAVLSSLTVYVFAVLQNSSRLPRTIATYTISPVIASIFAGAGLVSDIDRYADHRPAVVIRRTITQLIRIDRHSSKGPKYRYEGCFIPDDAANVSDEEWNLKLPRCMNLSAAQFTQLQAGTHAKFWIKRGTLGLPWYEAIISD